MSGWTALELSRIQFGFTITFHIIFPALTIGTASFLAVLEGCWLKTNRPVYQDLYHFWVKIFAVNFGMGVVSGLVMAYEFGTNWSGFSRFAGGITGPLLAYEVLTAFFLEAGFLGVMLFGWKKVGRGLHFFSTVMVALGTLVSATWIVASNSWMQTPQGFVIENDRAVPVDWFAVIFNPSFPYRLAHMSVAAFLATALFVGAAGAWHLRRGNDTRAVRKMMSMALWLVLVLAPIQALIGDAHGLNTLKFQPAKLAAIEGHWQNDEAQGMPLLLFGWPDMAREETKWAVSVPRLGGLLLTHDWNGQITGLKEFPKENRPNATIVFWTFRVMVGLGMLMIALGLWSLALRWRRSLWTSPLFLRVTTLMGPAGLIALLAGWFTTEIGRQPFVVYGVQRTADAVSRHDPAAVSVTLAAFVVVYFFVFGAGTVYVLRLVRNGPVDGEGRLPIEGGPGSERQPGRPMSAAAESVPSQSFGSSSFTRRR
jgi:cytochrome bd ubiquinol oxidase subunit I